MRSDILRLMGTQAFRDVQRELTKDYKRTNTDLKLKDKVALTIKDIAQAKIYCDVFQTDNVFLISLEIFENASSNSSVSVAEYAYFFS